MKIAFVLLSYAEDAPSGIERSVGGLLVGLERLGHDPFVVSAVPASRVAHGRVISVKSLTLNGSHAITDFEQEVRTAWPGLSRELKDIVDSETPDVICWVDALWGLGAFGAPRGRVASALMVHILGEGDPARIEASLVHKPDAVIAPSESILSQARRFGLDTSRWTVVPNALLSYPEYTPTSDARLDHRAFGPVRVLSRLGPEKGIVELLEGMPATWTRPVDVALAPASFEIFPGAQQELLVRCRALAASRPHVALREALTWNEVQPFLEGAAIVIIPSLEESFGLVALEAMSAGAPVVALSVDNLPNLIRDGGVIVPRDVGHTGLWAAAEQLVGDGDRYLAAAEAARRIARRYSPEQVAGQWLATVLSSAVTPNSERLPTT